MKEQVNHPEHYQGTIECIDAMISAFGEKNTIEFCKINASKYIWRAGKKDGNGTDTDLEKARWYINKAIELCTNQ